MLVCDLVKFISCSIDLNDFLADLEHHRLILKDDRTKSARFPVVLRTLICTQLCVLQER